MDLKTLMKHAAYIRKELFNLTTYIPRNESPNSYWGRTLEGLVLIQYYGCPGAIGTPIGKWSIDGGGYDYNKSIWFKKSQARFGLEEIRPLIISSMGEFGPIYAITKGIDGAELPTPKIDLVLNDVGFFSASKTDYAECVKQWEDIEPLLGDWKTVDKKEERKNNSRH